MSLRNYTIFVVLSTLVFLSGCSSTPTLPVISDADAFKVERKLLSLQKELKTDFIAEYKDPTKTIWIQPDNKTESCKVSIDYDEESGNITLDSNFKMYWDGECKNGYANGLGREFVKGTLIDSNILAIYHGNEEKPQYFVATYGLTGKTRKGDFDNGYYVERVITDNNVEFNVTFRSGRLEITHLDIDMFTAWSYSSPFSDDIFYIKDYGIFSYKIREGLPNVKFIFTMTDSENQAIGYGVGESKDGRSQHLEYPGLRKVSLPKSYLNRVSQIHLEIKEAVNKANYAAKKADKAIKQYTDKICKKSVSVNFIDNNEYKKICQNSEYNVGLRKKINAKFASVKQDQQIKREQDMQQILINARISQANSAKRAASAAEDANTQRFYQGLDQSFQNQNQNFQMQQLNTNLRSLMWGY
ncbi:MAG: hypothetical protein ABGY11_14025 [Candidatus Thioglobus sp.]|jgi:hypothetical protein